MRRFKYARNVTVTSCRSLISICADPGLEIRERRGVGAVARSLRVFG